MIEALSEIISLIGGAVTSIGIPLIGLFMFHDSKKRTEAAKAKQSEAEARKVEEENITSYAAEWKALYDQRDKRVDELNAKIDSLYQTIEDDRQRIRQLTEENTTLRLDGATYRCEKLGCAKRVPPNAYTPGKEGENDE